MSYINYKKGRTSKTFGCKTVYLKKNYGLKPEHENIHNFNLINSLKMPIVKILLLEETTINAHNRISEKQCSIK